MKSHNARPVSHLVTFSRIACVCLAAALVVLGLQACSKDDLEPEAPRPVRAMTINAANAANSMQFAGEVKPKVESQLGFRIPGKIIERKVDVGSIVRKGQVLMRLDAQDLELAQRQSDAALRSARSTLDLAQAELQRYRELREKNFVNQATLDAKETSYQQAKSSFEQAQAALRNQSNQTGYSELRSDEDGVVTAVNAEAGQVIAAGTPVVSVAKSAEKDVVIAVPENIVDSLRQVTDVRVHLWATPDNVMQGKVREVSPIADPATRTYSVKVSLPADAAQAKLGMTAYVSFMLPTGKDGIRLPLTALHENKGQTAVWVVENGAVKLVNVQLSGHSGNDILVSQGVSQGQVVVTAGVNMLVDGQKVSILGENQQASGDKTATAVADSAPEGKQP